MARDEYFILREKCKGYTLNRHVFKPSRKLWNETLQPGTILKEQPSESNDDPDKKKFVVADRPEVFYECRVKYVREGRLTQLTDEEAERLYKINSLEERDRSFRERLSPGGQHQSEGEVSQ